MEPMTHFLLKFGVKVGNYLIKKMISSTKWKNNYKRAKSKTILQLGSVFSKDKIAFLNDVVLTDDLVDEVARYTYNSRTKNGLEKLHNYLSLKINLYLSNDDSEIVINAFIESLLDQLRERELTIYLLLVNDQAQREIKLSNEQIEKITNELTIINENNRKYFTIDQIDDDLRNSAKDSRIGLDLFDFADSKFEDDVKKAIKIKNGDLIKISGKNQRETFYATLNVLKKMYPKTYNKIVYIYKNKNDWENIKNDLPKNSIVINYFFNEEIKVIQGSTNIHIVNYEEYRNSDIQLLERLKSSTTKALKRNGFNDNEISEFFKKTNNCFPNIFRYYFRYTSQLTTYWLSNIGINAIQTGMLLGQWSDISAGGDKAAIQYIFGNDLDAFYEKILSINLEEEPFVIKTTKHGYSKYFLADENETWLRFSNKLSSSIVQRFLDKSKEILITLPDYYKNYDNEDMHISYPSKEIYSTEIRDGTLRSLALLAFSSKPYSPYVKDIVKDVLDWCIEKDDANIFHYICNIMTDLVEIDPKQICDFLYKNIFGKGKIREFFSKEKANKYNVLSSGTYVHILFAIEKLLHINSTYLDAAKILFELCKYNTEYATSNSPMNTLEIILSSYINESCFTIQSKEAFIEYMFKEDEEMAWMILNKIIYNGSSRTWLGLSMPNITKSDFEPSYDIRSKDIIDLNTFYVNSSANHAKTGKQWCDIFKLKGYMYAEENTLDKILDIYNKSKAKFNDKDCIDLSIELADMIYKNKYFSDAQWKMDDSQIQLLENLLNKLPFKHQEYSYFRIFGIESYQINSINPTPNGKLTYQEEVKEKERYINDKIDEFINLKLNLEILENYIFKEGLINQWLLKLIFKYKSESSNIDISKELLLRNKNNKKGLIQIGIFLKDLDINSYFNLLSFAYKEVKKEAFIDLANCIHFDSLKSTEKDLFLQLDTDMQNYFWANNDNMFYGIETKNTYMFVLNNLRSNNNYKNYITAINGLNNREEFGLTGEDYLNLFSCNHEFFIQSYQRNYYEIQDIINYIEDWYTAHPDDEVSDKIARLELLYLQEYQSGKKIFIYDQLAKSPATFLDMLLYLYESNVEMPKNNTNILNNIYTAKNKLKFCPGIIELKFDKEIFDSWINEYLVVLKQRDQEKVGLYSLGGLFANSPTSSVDKIKPIEEIRDYIEKLDGDYLQDLLRGFEFGIERLNMKVREVDDGKTLARISKDYKSKADILLKEGYIKTSSAYSKLASYYEDESKSERNGGVYGK